MGSNKLILILILISKTLYSLPDGLHSILSNWLRLRTVALSLFFVFVSSVKSCHLCVLPGMPDDVFCRSSFIALLHFVRGDRKM